MHGVTTVGPDRRYPRQDCKNTGAIRPLINTDDNCKLPPIRQTATGLLRRRRDRVNSDSHDISRSSSVPVLRSVVKYARCGENSRLAGPPRPARTLHCQCPNSHESWLQLGKLPHIVCLEKRTWSMIFRPTDKKCHPSQTPLGEACSHGYIYLSPAPQKSLQIVV